MKQGTVEKIVIVILVIIITLMCTGCATSTTHFIKISDTEYSVIQRGQSDIEVDVSGKVKITNPQSTLGGAWEELKQLFESFSGIKTTTEIK